MLSTRGGINTFFLCPWSMGGAKEQTSDAVAVMQRGPVVATWKNPSLEV